MRKQFLVWNYIYIHITGLKKRKKNACWYMILKPIFLQFDGSWYVVCFELSKFMIVKLLQYLYFYMQLESVHLGPGKYEFKSFTDNLNGEFYFPTND